MILTRRQFVSASSLALVAGALRDVALFGQQQAPPPATPVFATVRGNVGTFTARGGTIGTLITPNALIVVDSQFADTAPLLLDGLKTRSQRKIDVLINSHHHGDHTGGNAVLKPSAAMIVSHAHAKALLEKAASAPNANAALKSGLPDTTFDKEWRQDVGGEAVSAKYYGPAHTGGDIVITFERANVVHMGDLMSFQRNPRADRPAGASIRGWIPVLENTVKDHGNDTIYIFGHSKVGERVTGSRADLMALRDYFTAMLDFVQKGLAAGRSQDEIVKVQAIPRFESWEGTPVALEAAYQELTARS
jgi:glyoxylase-like metal-dependent hydrolase (beta-lactamase superfamily II)